MKIKKTFLHITGALLAFIFNHTGVFAQTFNNATLRAIYGVDPISIYYPQTLFEKIISIVLSPIFIIVIILALIIGIIIFIRRKRKNVKKNS